MCRCQSSGTTADSMRSYTQNDDVRLGNARKVVKEPAERAVSFISDLLTWRFILQEAKSDEKRGEEKREDERVVFLMKE